MPQTLEQRRAAHALDRIKQHEKAQSYGKYVSYTSSLPATILMNGLGQACATLLSQKDVNGHKQLYDDLQAWLCGYDEAAPYPNATDLMKEITDKDASTYFRAQAEALAYLVWLKKLAKAFLEQGGN